MPEIHIDNEQLNISRRYSDSIAGMIREPLLILDEQFHIKSANSAFYIKFKTTEALTEGKLLFDLNNKQWNIPALRKLLENIRTDKTLIVDFEIIHHFPFAGERIMLLHTSSICINNSGEECILLTMEDITDKTNAERLLKSTNEDLRQLATHLEEVREEERESMAREIHDELGQQLTSIKMDISWLKSDLKSSSQDINHQIENIVKLIDGTIITVRKISTELRPYVLDDLGLLEAIQWHGSEFQNRSGIQVSFSTDLVHISLPTKMGIGLFRIFQESLTNVARHADAKNVNCSVTRDNDNIILKIRDDGQGFDISSISKKKTLGLLGMKERILMMKGKYEINSQPGIGTEISVTVPLPVGIE